MNLISLVAAFLPVFVEVWRPVWTGPEVPSSGWLIVPLMSVVAIFVVPRRHEGEKYVAAVRGAVVCFFTDPLAYVALALLLLLAVPLFNVGLCPACDAQAIADGASAAPPFRYLPFCVNVGEHLSVLRWFLSAIAVALSVRFGLRRKWKRIFCEVLVWHSALVSAYGFVRMLADDAPLEKGFSVFGYLNHGAAFFTVSFALSLGLWAMRQTEMAEKDVKGSPEAHPFWGRHYPLFPTALNLLGALATRSRAAMLFLIVLSAAFFGYVSVASMAGKRRVHRVRGLASLLLLLGLGVAVSVFAPPEIGREFATLTAQGIVDRTSGHGQYHERVATAIMRDYPFFGIGGWGYRHFCVRYLGPKELAGLQTLGGANVHNDYLQFIAEHGLVGFSLMVAVFFYLVRDVFFVWRGTYLLYKFTPTEKTPVSPAALFCVSPMMLFATLGCLCAMIHALGDCPLRSPTVLVSLLAVVAAIPGYDEKMTKPAVQPLARISGRGKRGTVDPCDPNSWGRSGAGCLQNS